MKSSGNEGKLLYLRYKQNLLGLLIRNGRLLSADVYSDTSFSLTGNIYIGKVLHVTRNIQAAFVEIMKGQPAFLSFQEIRNPLLLNRPYDGSLKEGDEIVVQVARDGLKGKHPALTTSLSLPGKYLVISRNNTRLGISVKLSEEKRKELTEFLSAAGLCTPARECVQTDVEHLGQYGFIVRTNAGNLEDLTPLLAEWEELKQRLSGICKDAPYRTCYSCLYQKREPFIEGLKNYNTEEYQEVITDCPDIYQLLLQEKQFEHTKIRLYTDEYPLAKLYSVGTLLHKAQESHVHLKSGAYLIIEPTEALTAIDVNTGKYEAGKSSEDTFFRINREAAEEIAVQIRLRNLSGMILVDFINMKKEAHRQELLEYLRELTSRDSIHTDVVDMTPLGLVEITRKRVNKPLRELLARTAADESEDS